MKWYYLVGLTVAVMVITYFIRIPLPSKGYFNFGDVAVVFSGLFLGWRGGAKLDNQPAVSGYPFCKGCISTEATWETEHSDVYDWITIVYRLS